MRYSDSVGKNGTLERKMKIFVATKYRNLYLRIVERKIVEEVDRIWFEC